MQTCLRYQRCRSLRTKILAFHSLILLPVTTMLIGLGRGRTGGLFKFIRPAVKDTISNPIIIGLVSGLAWSFTGLGIWGPLDKMTGMLSAAASPTALIALGAASPKHSPHRRRTAGGHDGGHAETGGASADRLVPDGQGPTGCPRRSSRDGHCCFAAGANVYLQANQFGVYVTGAMNAVMLTTLLSVISIT